MARKSNREEYKVKLTMKDYVIDWDKVKCKFGGFMLAWIPIVSLLTLSADSRVLWLIPMFGFFSLALFCFTSDKEI